MQINNSATFATWQGEIRGFESDMPGTLGDKCRFSSCFYKTIDDPEWVNANFINGTTIKEGSSDDKEWYFEYLLDNSFYIYDLNPLP